MSVQKCACECEKYILVNLGRNMLTLLGKGSMVFVIQAGTPVVVSRLHVVHDAATQKKTEVHVQEGCI